VRYLLDDEESFVLHYELKCFLFLEIFSTGKVFCRVLIAAINTSARETSCLLYFALCRYQDSLIFVLQKTGVKEKASQSKEVN